LLSARGGYEVAPAELAQRLIDLQWSYRALEGVTILGGEPFDQSLALAEALHEARATGLSTVVYSGHTYESLRETAGPAGALLDETDVLVDGPFLPDLHDPALIWRGSSNQRILPLTGRYSTADLQRAAETQGRSVFMSATTGPRGDVLVSGAQDRTNALIQRTLARELAHATGSRP
jgi:anaerobic ribonucleoside-triphosphate reductase activating protein